jgi:hypothetical protein
MVLRAGEKYDSLPVASGCAGMAFQRLRVRSPSAPLPQLFLAFAGMLVAPVSFPFLVPWGKGIGVFMYRLHGGKHVDNMSPFDIKPGEVNRY